MHCPALLYRCEVPREACVSPDSPSLGQSSTRLPDIEKVLMEDINKSPCFRGLLCCGTVFPFDLLHYTSGRYVRLKVLLNEVTYLSGHLAYEYQRKATRCRCCRMSSPQEGRNRPT